MELIKEKSKEVLASLLPIMGLVFVINMTLVPVDLDLVGRFILGGLFLFVGLSVFLIGVEVSMEKIGKYMAEEIVTSKFILKAIGLTFVLGFLITVAEPDLLILGKQIEDASGGDLGSSLIVYVVSFGVGLMISLGIVRTFKGFAFNKLMAIIYGLIFVLTIFVAEEFLAISFDASGATTGALTTPFVLALGNGIARYRGGENSEKDSFGLVGLMSSGPILGIMFLSILSGQSKIEGGGEAFEVIEGVFAPVFSELLSTLPEALTAILPLVLLFLAFNYFKFKLDKEEIYAILVGIIFTVLGLGVFLAGVNAGFMEMGRTLGMGLGENYVKLLPIIGLIMGMIVVLAEPAVHVLGEQIEDVSGGSIPQKAIKITLSIGVGIAIGLSMLRIMIVDLKLWHFLLPGFLLAIILSFYVDPIFVGIAFDAGGVASGPMTATFILAFAQGAAELIDSADVLVDGFGIIAMVAMTPILSIMLLGALFKLERKKADLDEVQSYEPSEIPAYAYQDVAVVAIVDRGRADEVVDIARSEGATGATILHARRSDNPASRIFDLELQAEKEIIYLVTDLGSSHNIVNAIVDELDLSHHSEELIFVLPVEASMSTAL
ncbi:DUF1538 domain-containing protein [Anaerococcus sp. AGMB09787]|uniref:DUF1538 domain-containing protein n=1 Tax=Anaerococcus sp. AGMB09787 TaxID=2922869 RepID=UPI001FAE7625|nr:DUF1538 domain-containing protein [Anaerococcus sp. AGMB09787]